MIRKLFAALAALLIFAAPAIAGTSASGLTGALSPAPDVTVQYQTASGVAGTLPASGSPWTLNTVVRNVNSVASLASSTVTLPAGTWYICGTAAARGNTADGTFILAIVNSTDATVVAKSPNSTLSSTANSGSQNSVCTITTTTASKGFILRFYSVTAGIPATSGNGPEVWAEFNAWKVG